MYFLLIIINCNNNLKSILTIILLFNIYQLPWMIIIILIIIFIFAQNKYNRYKYIHLHIIILKIVDIIIKL